MSSSARRLSVYLVITFHEYSSVQVVVIMKPETIALRIHFTHINTPRLERTGFNLFQRWANSMMSTHTFIERRRPRIGRHNNGVCLIGFVSLQSHELHRPPPQLATNGLKCFTASFHYIWESLVRCAMREESWHLNIPLP